MNMKKDHAIGVDLGGTNLRVGIVANDGHVELSASVPVGPDKSAERVAALIAEQVSFIQVKTKNEIAGCGLGIPGIIDADEGVVYSSPNFPLWNDTPIKKLLTKRIKVPLVIDNDANMFALAELLFGAGRGHKNLIMLTLGSGIGGGIIIDGKVFHGDSGFAGEVGHIVVEPEGVPCGCGSHGCWEQYAASRAFSNLVERIPKGERDGLLALAEGDPAALTPLFMAGLAESGNMTAIDMWRLYGKYLGIGIASLINALGITTIVIGGGIARSQHLFIDAVRAEIANRTYKKNVEHLKLLSASLGEDTAIVGAASAVFRSGL